MKSLRTKLLLTVAAIIVGCGVSLSAIMTFWYSHNLYQITRNEAERLAHQLALESTEKVLINDIVALQKMIDYNMSLNTSLSYLFIVRNGQVQAHSFQDGFPIDLATVNYSPKGDSASTIRLNTVQGETYYDIAWPIFDGNGGVLRLGISEIKYIRQVRKLWIHISLITLALLIVGFLTANLFIRKMTRPLLKLADAAGKIDEGRLDLKVSVQSHDEVERVAAAFNAMLNRVKDYTQRLEAKRDEINQAYNQTRKSFEILQQIGSQPTIADVCLYMIQRFKEVVACQKMAMVVFFDAREDLMLVTEQTIETLDSASYHHMSDLVYGLDSVTFLKRDRFGHKVLPADFEAADRLVVVPIHHEQQLISALVIACVGNCACNKKGLDVIELIFKQAAGGIKRAAVQEAELRNLHDQIDRSTHFSGIVGKHAKMKTIYQLIKDTAPTEAAVLIQGESGTGKELVARAVHQHSRQKKGPFVVINCSAFPATLLESELFGHEKGAFTGAVKRKLGRFEQAHGGTVFLDEIGEISLSAQVKLLRVLQTHRFERIGGEQTIEVDVRVISATNKNLMDEIKKGHFREDLFYRLNVIPIHLPPLRLRKNDIPILARHFLSRDAKAQNKHRLTDFSAEVMRQLMAYAWPGNVRELENAVEHSVVLAKGTAVQVADLPLELRGWRGTADAQEQEAKKTSIASNEKKLLLNVLQETGWNKKLSAQKLGISRSTLYNKLRKYAIRKERRKVADQHRPQYGS